LNHPLILAAYLALVAWNLERLHAELLSRRVFGTREGFS